jgi:tRNA dimethylallyltransferase
MDRLLAVVGPTAAGKTAAAVCLAELLGGEIVSADAVAVYRRLDIGAAKPDPDERVRAAFHAIDVAEPTDDFSVTDFDRHASTAIAAIRARGCLPILAGGTGLYVRAVTSVLAIPEVPPQPELRAALWEKIGRDGAPALHQRLAQVDPIAASKIAPGDGKRIIRALEVWTVTKRPLSSFHTPEGVHGTPKPGVALWGLRWDRAALYRRIEARVDAMLAAGFVDEVRDLLDSGVPETCKSMQSLGYRHLVQYVRKERSLSEAIDAIKADTRRFAKRQLSWFGNDPRVRWIDVREGETAVEIAVRLAKEHERALE